ncbi:MAG: hypothetical protein LBH69_01975 [Methanomassiliicoccaceae archaeon]|jgi:hypothetical protein|nr:hypothetical protein [Methanomassiliicoccaceae archaeon]
MIMVSPDGHLKEIMDMSYEELIHERDYLIMEISQYKDNKGSHDGIICPSPELIHKYNRLYLKEVRKQLRERFGERIPRTPAQK